MTTIALHPTPQIRDSEAEAMLDEIYPEVLELVTAAIESTTEGVEIERIQIHVTRQPEDTSGWRELVFTLDVNVETKPAFDYWGRLEEFIENGTDRLGPEARHQLAANVGVHVHPVGTHRPA